MKVSSKGRYALRMMIEIAQRNTDDWVSIKEISKTQRISVKYLEQIVSMLTKSGLLVSGRGPRGGYKLVKPVEKYTVGEIIHAIEGKFAPVSCLETETNECEFYKTCNTVHVWEGLHEVVSNYLDSITLDKLVNSKLNEGTFDYSI